MEQSRRQFLSEGLAEVTQLVESNPWSPAAEAEIEKFVATKLAADVAKFETASTTLWEKLYGALAVRAGTVAQSAGFGGGAGGVVGNVIPGTTAWGMVLAGALAGASKEVPAALKDVIASQEEARSLERSGVAYVARFQQRAEKQGNRRGRRRGRR